MNTLFSYALDKSSKKFFCPSCNKKRFVRYIDVRTGEYLPIIYGRCDRLDNCNYHLNPLTDGYGRDNQRFNQPRPIKPINRPSQTNSQRVIYFDKGIYNNYLSPSYYDYNTFARYLSLMAPFTFDKSDIIKVLQLYRAGTIINPEGSQYMNGAMTIPFIDINGNIRAVQVKLFDENNHGYQTNYLHQMVKHGFEKNGKDMPLWLKDYTDQEKKVSCLFGEHLLKLYPSNPVNIVEAPKTAIYCTLYFGLPEKETDIIWLAVGAKDYLNFDVFKILKGRRGKVYPDLSTDGKTYKEWNDKIKSYVSMLPGTTFVLSDLIERLANKEQRQNGSDIADILIKWDWRQFRKDKPTTTANKPQNEPLIATTRQFNATVDIMPVVNQMRAKNPYFTEVVNMFDLKLITEYREPEIQVPNNTKKPIEQQQATTTRRKKTLSEIVALVMEQQNHFSHDEIVNRIMNRTGTPIERAQNGFNLMLKNGLIAPTTVGTYYLSTSTPF